MNIKIERNTRHFLGTFAVGVFVAVMIVTGKIPATVYQHWEGLLVGALFYHIVKMLNSPAAKLDHVPNTGEMVPMSDHIGGVSQIVSTPTPPQATQENLHQ